MRMRQEMRRHIGNGQGGKGDANGGLAHGVIPWRCT
jgi:hypothetical protein